MSSSQYAGKPTLGNLPLELIREISTYLPAYSVAALSLTCKDLYNDEMLRQSWTQGFSQAEKEEHYHYFFSMKLWMPHFRSREIANLLRLLEKDLPHMSACGHCERLHAIRKVPLRMSRQDCECWSPCSKAPDLGMWLHWDDWDFNLSYEHVEAFARYHFLGPKFGSSTEKVNLGLPWHVHQYSKKYQAEWMRKLSLRPTIIDDHLIIRTTQYIMVSDHYLQSLADDDEDCIHVVANLASCSLKICQCCNAPEKMLIKQEIKRQLSKLLRNDSASHSPSDLDSGLYRCSTCLTEFQISLLKHDEKGLYELVLNAWTNLGSCASTYHPAWVLATSLSGYLYAPDSIRKLRRLAMLRVKYPNEHMQLMACTSAIDDPSLRSFLEQHAGSSQPKKASRGSNGMRDHHDIPTMQQDILVMQQQDVPAKQRKVAAKQQHMPVEQPCNQRQEEHNFIYNSCLRLIEMLSLLPVY